MTKRELAFLAAAAAALPLWAARPDLAGAAWIGEAGTAETAWKHEDAKKARGITGTKGHDFIMSNPLPKHASRLRRTFAVAAKKIAGAKLVVAAGGFCEAWVNGKKADPTRVLAPAVGPSRHFADTYDVTALLRSGEENAIGLWLAPGYSDDFSRYGGSWLWLAPKRARARLEIRYADGTAETVLTDGKWESTLAGPVTKASIYHGEEYDARLEDAGWCAPGGAKKGWSAATVFPDGPKVDTLDAVPIRLSDPRRPVKIEKKGEGKYLLDFGQNRAGVVRLRAKGPAGTKITVQTAELLKPGGGELDLRTNRRAKSRDTFILAGTGGVEEYTPRFTYHGFRYALVEGWPGEFGPDSAESVAVHADLKETLKFKSSSAVLNKLHNAAHWSMLSNFVSYPTDCCMRDERTACQMDSQTYEDVACMCFDMRDYYWKWTTDFHAPAWGNPDWSGQSVLLPFRLYEHYGEKRFLEEGVRRAEIYQKALLKRCPDRIFREGFGDWCAPNDGTWKSYHNDVAVVNTAIFCDVAAKLAAGAAELGRPDAEKFAKERDLCRAAFHKEFFNAAESTYGDGSQANMVLALAFGIVPENLRAAVGKALAERMKGKDKRHIDTGIYGTRYLGEVLCDIGEEDLLMEAYSQKTYPGFGHLFERGATTLWEQWTYDGGMNSHNHAMMSGGAMWMYSRLAGIRPLKPGYAETLVKPCFPKGVDSVETKFATVNGEIAVRWRRAGGSVTVETEVPKGMKAFIELPGGGRRALKEGFASVAFADR